ncbi:MAG: HAMP domain-containing histidine kinase [Lachnospiraceae bacterium]|nr:HAMP domain-containing histidine kinase [Lachnospiraceae bacterium]
MRLAIVAALLLFGILSSLIATRVIVSTQFTRSMNNRLMTLTNLGQMLANNMAAASYAADPAGPDAQVINTQISLIADIYDGRFVVVDKRCRIVEDSYNLELGRTIIADRVIRGLRGESTSQINEKSQLAEIVIPVNEPQTENVSAGSSSIGAVLIMSFNVKDVYDLSASLRMISRLLLVLFSVLMLVAAVLIALRMTRPFRQLKKTVNRVSEGQYDFETPKRTYTELKDLQGSITTMLERLRQQEESRQQFVSDVSHELKTPITSIKVLSDSLLSQEDAPAEMYREFLGDISKEIDRENKIIQDLLALVKADKQAEELKISEVSINELVEQNLRRVRPIAEQRSIDLVYESFRDVRAQVDEVKLSLAITNLVENAIKYNHDNGWVHVSLNADHQFFFLKVEDNGVGIPEEDQDRIFDRFYRVDKARSRDTGGTGLGLSITRNVILMHGGNLKVYSRPGEGSTFTMRIPLYQTGNGGVNG